MVFTLIKALVVAGACYGNALSNARDTAWTLERCIDYALQQNIQVRKSTLSNEISVFYAGQARAQRFPSLGVSVNQNFNWSRRNTGDPTFAGSNGTSYNLNSGVTLFNYSRINNLIKQAELEIESGIYSLETAREALSLSILNAFLQVLYAEEQVKNSMNQIEATASQLNLAAERLELKAISQADYSQVKAQLAGEKLTLSNSESQLAIAKVNLMQLMELPVNSDFSIVHPVHGEHLNEYRLPEIKAVYETALAIKPQVKGASVNKEIAALDTEIAKAGYYPVLSASAGIGSSYSSMFSDPYFNQVDDGIKPGIGLSLSIPIYQKKQVKTSIAVARINYENAGLNELETRNQLRKNIEQASQDVLSAQAEYDASLEKYRATNESTLLAEEKFRQGMINSVDYLVSKTNLIVAESQLLQSKFNLIFSYKIMDFYMGVPFVL